MSERINVANTAYASGAAIQAGVNAAVTSLRYDRAIARQAAAMNRLYQHELERARVRVAQANIRIILGL